MEVADLDSLITEPRHLFLEITVKQIHHTIYKKLEFLLKRYDECNFKVKTYFAEKPEQHPDRELIVEWMDSFDNDSWETYNWEMCMNDCNKIWEKVKLHLL